MTCKSQSGCFISASHIYATIKFVYDIFTRFEDWSLFVPSWMSEDWTNSLKGYQQQQLTHLLGNCIFIRYFWPNEVIGFLQSIKSVVDTSPIILLWADGSSGSGQSGFTIKFIRFSQMLNNSSGLMQDLNSDRRSRRPFDNHHDQKQQIFFYA